MKNGFTGICTLNLNSNFRKDFLGKKLAFLEIYQLLYLFFINIILSGHATLLGFAIMHALHFSSLHHCTIFSAKMLERISATSPSTCIFHHSPLTLHALPTHSPLTPHSLPTRSPIAHHSLTTCSPLAHHLLTTCSPLAHHYLTTRSLLTHHSLTTHSLLTHQSLTAHSLLTHSPLTHRSLTTRVGHPFFSKERSDLCVLFRSL